MVGYSRAAAKWLDKARYRGIGRYEGCGTMQVGYR